MLSAELARMPWIVTAVTFALVAASYAFLGIHMRLRTRRLLDHCTVDSQQVLQVLLDVSRHGDRLKWTRLVLLYAGLGALVITLVAREWLGLAIAAAPIALRWWVNIRTTTAPAVLLLGTSTHSSVNRQRAVKRRLAPLRVVSLLDTDVPWDPALAAETNMDCFRTTNEGDWWPVITSLMELAPVIAIDTGAETAGVLREGAHILDTELARKCLFLTPPDGSAPVLDCLLPEAAMHRSELRFARYEDAPGAIAVLLSELAGRGG